MLPEWAMHSPMRHLQLWRVWNDLPPGDVCCFNISGTVCADLSTDMSNCGSCGSVCSLVGGSCSNGVCACPQNQTNCGNTCANLSNDVNNCGSCGNACAFGNAVCIRGLCTCPPQFRILFKGERPGFDLPSTDPQPAGLESLALRRFAFCSCCFCFEHPDLGLGLTLRSLTSVFGPLQLRLNLGV